jgi:hypothetical protein
MSSISRGFSRISMTPSVVETRHTPGQHHVRPVKREPRIQAVLDAIHALEPIKRIEFFEICFPSMSHNEANLLTLNTHTKIKKEWLDLRTMYHYMFTLQDALTSDHSPLSASYVPSLRMFHRNSLLNEWSGDHYNCPPAFMAIPPTDKLYKQGGPLFRIFNDEAGLMKDIMACNDAFCKICVVSRVPPPENPEQNLHSMPFVHHRSLGYGFEDARPEGGQENLLFTGNASTGFGSVLPTSACRPNFCGVIMIDRVQRSVVVCDSARCEECQGAA